LRVKNLPDSRLTPSGVEFFVCGGKRRE